MGRYAYDARLEEVTPHTLRHTFGKNLVDAGVPLDWVASLLGHESVDTTRTYTIPLPGDVVLYHKIQSRPATSDGKMTMPSVHLERC